MDEIRRARKLTEEILARAASIKTHMAQVNQSMANMAVIEEENKARTAREAAEAAKSPLGLMDLPDDLLRLVAGWCGRQGGSGTTPSAWPPSARAPGPAPAGSGAAPLAALAITCRRWRRLALLEPELWEDLCRRRWGVVDRTAATVPVLDPRHLHLAAGWPAAALGSGGGGGMRAGAGGGGRLAGLVGLGGTRPLVGKVRSFGGSPASPAAASSSSSSGSLRGAAARTPSSPSAASSPTTSSSPTWATRGTGGPAARGQAVPPPLLSLPDCDSGARTARVQPSPPRLGGGSGSRRQLLPALPPSPSRRQPPSPSRPTRGAPVGSTAAASPPTSPHPSPHLSPGKLLIPITSPSSSAGPSPSGTGKSFSAADSPGTPWALTASPDAPTRGSSPPGPASLYPPPLPSPTAASPGLSPRATSTKPASPGAAAPGSAAAAAVPLLPGGDALEPVPLGWVLRRMGRAGGERDGGGGGAGAGGACGGWCGGEGVSGGGPNLWQLVYRDRLVAWRGVMAVFRWLQSHGYPGAVSGSLHRQQLLLALRYLHLLIRAGAAPAGGAGPAVPPPAAAAAVRGDKGGSGGAADEDGHGLSGAAATRRVAEVLAAELLLAVPGVVPCLLALLANDSGLVVELAAAGLADMMALDQERLTEELLAAAAAAQRGRRDDPGVVHHVRIASNGGRFIAAQLRDGVRSPGIVRQVSRCLVNLWAEERVPRVVPLPLLPGAGGGGGAALPVLEGGVWQLQEFSTRGDLMRLIHTVITFRQGVTVAPGPEADDPRVGRASDAGSASLLSSAPSSLFSTGTPTTTHGSDFRRTTYSGVGSPGGSGLGAGGRRDSDVGGGGGMRQSWAGEGLGAAASSFAFPMMGPDGRPLGGTAAALVALGGGTGARWGGGRPVVELLGGGYDVMLPRGALPGATPAAVAAAAAAARGGGAGSLLSNREAEEFRLSGWLDASTGEWHMQRRCVNVPFALLYKGYSDAHGCWGTCTVQQEPGQGRGPQGGPGVGAGQAATVAGGSSMRVPRVFRLFRDPTLPPPDDLMWLLAAMQEQEQQRQGGEVAIEEGEDDGASSDGDLPPLERLAPPRGS